MVFSVTTHLARVRTVCILALVVLLSATGVTAKQPGRSHKFDGALRKEMASRPAGEKTRVLLRVNRGSQDQVRKEVERRRGRALKSYRNLGTVLVEVTRGELERLAARGDVTALSVDAPVRALAQTEPTPEWMNATLLPTLGLQSSTLTGNGVGVAVIDSGVRPSGDLQPFASVDFVNGQSAPTDGYGHGTHVAGLVGGSGAMSNGLFRGVAPGVRIINLKVLDSDGTGSTSNVLQAIEYAIENRVALGIDVINMSLGHPVFESLATDPLVQAVEAASRAGIVVVISAGNVGINPETGQPGYAGILSPGNAPSAITVGALNTQHTTGRGDDTVTDYSSRGPTMIDTLSKPDLVAPGHNMVSVAATNSTLYTNFPHRHVSVNNGPAKYLRLNGTSMSAAVTTGVVALMIEAGRTTFQQSLTPNAIKAMLQYSALPLAGANALVQGTGALNAGGAVDLALASNPTVAMGESWQAGGVNPVTTIDNQPLPWSQTFIWGNNVIGGNAVFFNLPPWAQTVVWGNDDTVVWGNDDTVVWGNDDTVVWGNDDTVVWGNSWFILLSQP